MKNCLLVLIMMLVPALSSAQPRLSRPLVLKHVAVIDMTGAPARPLMTVVIIGGRVVAIGKSSAVSIPKNAYVIDAKHKFLIPGLWDMHVHIGNGEFDKKAYLRLFLANGITGIRIMEGAAEFHDWRQQIEAGKLTGPRMIIGSEMIGAGTLSNISPASARAEAVKASQQGADFIKVHDNVLRDSYFALIDEARRLALPVEGHVPGSITAAEASNAGQKSIEHFTGLDEASNDAAKADTLAAVFVRNGTWLCPTLIMRSNYASLDNATLANDVRLAYVKPSWKKRWLTMTQDAIKISPADWSARKETVRKEERLVGKMEKAGVGVLAGTDDANPYTLPGFSLHDELALLVESGLTPMQALQAATVNPAKFFNKLDLWGTVAKNKVADFVLLDANPLNNIKNTKRIYAVIVNGRYYSKHELSRMLDVVRTEVQKLPQD